MSGNVCELEEEKFTSLEHSNKLDSNVITPGTEFMSLLSSALRYYLHLKMNEDLGWRGLKVPLKIFWYYVQVSLFFHKLTFNHEGFLGYSFRCQCTW